MQLDCSRVPTVPPGTVPAVEALGDARAADHHGRESWPPPLRRRHWRKLPARFEPLDALIAAQHMPEGGEGGRGVEPLAGLGPAGGGPPAAGASRAGAA